MANYNFSLTGTKGSGESLPATDWTDANCYSQASIHSLTGANGDTFGFNETNTGAGISIYVPSFEVVYTKGITITTRYGAAGDGAMLQRASGGTLCTINPDSTAAFVANDLKFSSANVSTRALNIAAGAIDKSITLNRVELAGLTANFGIELGLSMGSLVISDLIVSGTFASSIMFGAANLGLDGVTSVTIDGITMNGVSLLAAGTGYGLLLRGANAANATSVTFAGTVSGVITNTGGGAISALEIQGVNTVSVSGFGASGQLELASSSSGVNSYGIIIRGLDAGNRQTVNAMVEDSDPFFNCPAGDAISCGFDPDNGLNYTVNPTIRNCNPLGIAATNNTPHGIVLRGLSSGQAYANHCRRFHSPLMLSKCDNDAVEAYGNLITDGYGPLTDRGVGLSLKGNSGGVMHDNTVIITPNSIDGSASNNISAIWARAQDVNSNTASKAYNNNIIWLGMPMPDFGFSNVATGHANTFSSNNYYTDQTLPTSPFTYTGTGYADVTAWNAAQETNNATATAIFNTTAAAIIAAFGNLPIAQLVASAATVGGGEKWWGNNPRPDTLLEPLPDTDIDRGVQSANSVNHPSKL